MSRTVFVDDTDPNIRYTGDWTQLTGLPTGQPSTSSSGHTPRYGNLHALNSVISDSWSISYTFTGPSVVAYFQGSSTEGIVSCTVDGKSYDPGLDNGGGVHCAANVLGQGSHTIVLQVKSVWNAILFDGIMYTTDGAPNGSDLIYYFQDASGVEDLKSPGDKLDFTFTGTSGGLYVLYWHNDALDNGPSSVQYTVDGGSPVKFTVTTPPTQPTLKYNHNF
ncbi:hypothetical protein CPC08DRAFT_380684 [Agrocybe pediades]|nr:hypothetical protein CPC08DRAFT_380684 [Agrocybe pediades]